jgi:hypothetical protein
MGDIMKKLLRSRVTVSHACNASYSGGRDQEGHALKPAWANSSLDPVSKNPSQRRAGRVTQGEGLEFKLQYHKKQTKTNKQKNQKNG